MKDDTIRIVTDKTTSYKIFFPYKATDSERFAAQEIKKYICLTTGVNIPTEPEIEPCGKYISVGNTLLWQSIGYVLDKKALNGDGFIIKTVGNNVYLAAATARGIMYAVYGFLEKFCGVRFLNVDEVYLPHIDELSFAPQNEINVPSFRYRAHISDVTYHTPDCRGYHIDYEVPIPVFYAQSRQTHEFIYLNKGKDVGKTDAFFKLLETVGGGIPLDVSINPTHNNLTYVPPDEYFATEEQRKQNAHLFYISDGKVLDIRYSDGIAKDGTIEKGVNTASICLEALKKQILSQPDAVYFNCGQQDLKEFDDSCGMEHGSTYMVLRFYNAIAKAIKKWAEENIPERTIRIVIFSYLFTRDAPPVVDDSVILCDNVVLRFADLTSNTNYPLTSEYSYRPDVFPDLKYGPDYFEKWKPFIKNCAEIWY